MYYPDFFKGYIKNYFRDSNFSGVYTNEDGTKASYINGLPCYIEYSNGKKEWYKEGKLHREDSPAIEWENGKKYWYKEGELHLENGPAKEYINGYRAWYREGNLHRVDGHAVEYANGSKQWWIEGVEYSREKFKTLTDTSVFLEIERGRFNLEWIKFLTDKAIEEFPIIPGMEEDSEFKPFFELIK